MYDFIRLQWVMRKIDADTVNSFAPRWITAEQAAQIIATPQVPGVEA